MFVLSLLSVDSTLGATGFVKAPDGVDPSTLTIELLDMGVYFHPLKNGYYNVPFEGVEAVVFSDGHNFPTELFTLAGEGQWLDLTDTPDMEPGMYHTLNLKGRIESVHIMPNHMKSSDVYIVGTTVHDQLSNYRYMHIYPTVMDDASELQIVVRNGQAQSRLKTLSLDGVPRKSSHNLGEISIDNSGIELLKEIKGTPATDAKTSTSSTTAVESPLPLTSTPVTSIFDLVLPALLTIAVLSMMIGTVFAFRRKLSEMAFRAILSTGRYDKHLSLEYTEHKKALLSLRKATQKLRAKIRELKVIASAGQNEDSSTFVKESSQNAQKELTNLREDERKLQQTMVRAKDTQQHIRMRLVRGDTIDQSLANVDDLRQECQDAQNAVDESNRRLAAFRQTQKDLRH